MTTIAKEGNSLSPDALVTLFEFDVSPILDEPTGSDTYYYTDTSVGNESGILWGGNVYTPFPFVFKGISSKADGTAPARPTITVSNINEVFYAAFLSIGDLTGSKVVRHRTFYKFTEAGSEPNPLAEFPINKYIVMRKVKQDKFTVEYELGTAIDQPLLKLPKRLILRDETLHNLHAPGVSRTRLRG
ncbi:MAG: phage minor tail protein L [Chloroflexi bacterium]|nr:MAG: phage minor tail protein L [Chloroflexota bacterium]